MQNILQERLAENSAFAAMLIKLPYHPEQAPERNVRKKQAIRELHGIVFRIERRFSESTKNT